MAAERYTKIGVDIKKAISILKGIPISIHCWQGDDVGGFETPDAELSGGGIQVTGSYPGKARNIRELRCDLEKAFSLIPGEKRLNLHAIYGEFNGKKIDRDQIKPEHFEGWLKWAETNLGYESLRYVNNLQPTAELRPPEKSQTDEKDLMPYKIITQIEILAIRDHRSPVEVFQILNKKNLEPEHLLREHIKKFFLLWSRNQWKRERTAPAFHLDDFNVDPRTWCRFPILSGSFKEELEEL
jgi:hypothetical protein